MAESSVKVGLRIRPLVAKEKDQNFCIDKYDCESVVFKGQPFTFDHVFGPELNQGDLYQQTAGQMLKNVLEGYNCTVIAYGQTGSGKTYTMGTSDLACQNIEDQGLIPRFVNDLFNNLHRSNERDGLINYKVTASFLEIYGEDVFDLLSQNQRTENSRTSLVVREDEQGRVFVQSLIDLEVNSPTAALEILRTGSMNRITASTAMNAGSSRSHAVFTLHIEQSIKSSACDDGAHHITSKLTFVDLAGSERIKRTGAEGQRMKEGIQINSGLFNLGQVINSLADDQRIKNGSKRSFIPYRNSKLTHLLKDALGGNSQTLFIACVSPAEINESETHSTLNYARQARNIKNKPVKNMDKTQEEIRRLKYSMKAWMIKAVSLAFNESTLRLVPDHESNCTSGLSNVAAPEVEDENLLKRPEVIEYINAMNTSISQKLDGFAPTPRKIRLSVGLPSHFSPNAFMSPSYKSQAARNLFSSEKGFMESQKDYPDSSLRHGRESILFSSEISNIIETTNNLDASEELVQRMMTMVDQEKRLLGVIHERQENENESEDSDENDIVAVDQLIKEKEEILEKLMDNIKSYNNLKQEFEKLVDAINGLEDEKRELEAELEKSKKGTGNGAVLERIKERFATVKEELKKMKEDKKTKEQAYRLMQRESKQCETMQKEIQKLKEAKVNLVRQQKVQSQQLQKLKKDQNQQLTTYKKSDVKKQQLVNTLKSELVKKERILAHKEREIGRVTMKLKACEDHITQLLRLQNRNRSKIQSTPASSKSLIGKPASEKAKCGDMEVGEQEHFVTSKAILEQALLVQVDRRIIEKVHNRKVQYLRSLNAQLLEEAANLESLLKAKSDILAANSAGADDSPQSRENELPKLVESDEFELSSLLFQIDCSETKIESLSKELDLCNTDVDDLSLRIEDCKRNLSEGDENTWDVILRETIASLSEAQSRALITTLLLEKSSHLEALKMAESELSIRLAECDNLVRNQNLLQNQIQKQKNEQQNRLMKLERQRVQDIWAILKANTESSSVLTSSLDAASRALLQRSKDLEEELEVLRNDNQSLGSTLAGKSCVVSQLENKVEALNSQLQTLSLLRPSQGESQGETCASAISHEFIAQLMELWNKIGTDVEERKRTIVSINKSNEIAKHKALQDAQTSLSEVQAEFTAKWDILKQLQSFLCAATTEEIDQEIPIVKHICDVDLKIDSAAKVIAENYSKWTVLKDQMNNLMSEMWLQEDDLPEQLKNFARLHFPSHVNNLDNVVSFVKHSLEMSICVRSFQDWSDSLQRLNLERMRTTSTLIPLKERACQLLTDLELCDREDIQSLIVSVFSDDGDFDNRGTSAVVQILTLQTASNPPGSLKLLSAFEKVILLLESVKVNRTTVCDRLKLLVDAFETITEKRNVVYPCNFELSKKSTLQFIFHDIQSFPDVLKDFRERVFADILQILCNLNGFDQATGYQAILDASRLSMENESDISFLRVLDDVTEELGQLSIFLEERWIQELLCSAVFSLNKMMPTMRNPLLDESSCFRALVRETMFLEAEKKRLISVQDIFCELQRSDAQLSKHVTELEEFEVHSKQDRQKALAGNSKMLIEEEKYRKAGKKKFEMIAEKMTSTHSRLYELISSPLNETFRLEVKLNFNSFSLQGRALFKGELGKERVELMRLNTSVAAGVATSTSQNSGASISSNRKLSFDKSSSLSAPVSKRDVKATAINSQVKPKTAASSSSISSSLQSSNKTDKGNTSKQPKSACIDNSSLLSRSEYSESKDSVIKLEAQYTNSDENTCNNAPN